MAASDSQLQPTDSLCEEYVYPTMFGPAEVFILQTEDGTPVRVLYVAGGFQSATYLGAQAYEPVFAYYRALDCVFLTDRPIDRMLVIGGGAFSYPKHLLASKPQVNIDVVEIDPAIVGIAREHFFLDDAIRKYGTDQAGNTRLGIFVQDGAEYLAQSPGSIYDVIINDSFDGVDPTASLLSHATLIEAKRALREGGIYLINAIAQNKEEAAPFAQALRKAFAHVYLYPCPDDDFAGSCNNLILASEHPIDLEGTIALWDQPQLASPRRPSRKREVTSQLYAITCR